MSGLLVVSGNAGSPRLRPAIARLAALGSEDEHIWLHEDTLFVVTRNAWEMADDFSGSVLVHESGDLVVAADATLYDRAGLARALDAAGVHADGATPTHLLAAAYRAWGTAMVEHLIGDYAFVIWDRRNQRLLAARDPIGLRGLFFARMGSGVAIASSPRCLATLVGRESDVNLAIVAVQAAGLAWSLGAETSFTGVDAIPPGHRMTWKDRRLSLERYWHPPAAPNRRPKDRSEAAEELLELLRTAVSERMGSGTSTVWMSGGWDSTALFGAGQSVLAADARSKLRPVSISYPRGDPGFEDDYIRQVASFWNADVHWIDSENIPLLDGLERRAAAADEPPPALYELWNRELARGTRACGSRVALDGNGGDQLFQASDVVLADLLRTGRWIQLARFAKSRLIYGRRHVVQASLFPLVPEWLLRASERLTGQRVRQHYLERPIAGWMRSDCVVAHDLRERELLALRSTRSAGIAHAESTGYMTNPAWAVAGSSVRAAVLQEGVEMRSPLMDLRVVEFALARPISDRADHAGTKHVLRQSVRRLLPASVLAPRQWRTGVTIGYSRRRMTESYPRLLGRLFAEPLRLADLGLVDPDALRRGAEQCCAGGGNDWLRVNLFNTMKVEFWLRGLGAGRQGDVMPSSARDDRFAIPAA
jgi:asparagine synthase (glutamine-hydrolysing)